MAEVAAAPSNEEKKEARRQKKVEKEQVERLFDEEHRLLAQQEGLTPVYFLYHREGGDRFKNLIGNALMRTVPRMGELVRLSTSPKAIRGWYRVKEVEHDASLTNRNENWHSRVTVWVHLELLQLEV